MCLIAKELIFFELRTETSASTRANSGKDAPGFIGCNSKSFSGQGGSPKTEYRLMHAGHQTCSEVLEHLESIRATREGRKDHQFEAMGNSAAKLIPDPKIHVAILLDGSSRMAASPEGPTGRPPRGCNRGAAHRPRGLVARHRHPYPLRFLLAQLGASVRRVTAAWLSGIIFERKLMNAQRKESGCG